MKVLNFLKLKLSSYPFQPFPADVLSPICDGSIGPNR